MEYVQNAIKKFWKMNVKTAFSWTLCILWRIALSDRIIAISVAIDNFHRIQLLICAYDVNYIFDTHFLSAQ